MSKNHIKVLLIEDDPDDIIIIRDYLTQNNTSHSGPPPFELLHVEYLEAGLAYLSNIAFDVVLLDLTLPDSRGINTFLHMHQAHPTVPVIVLSGHDDLQLALEAVQQGAQDYLVKDDLFSTQNLLVRSIQHAIERQRLLTEIQEKTQELAASEARRRSIIENNADGILILNKKGIIRLVNPAAERLLQLSKEKLLGTKFSLPQLKTGTTEFSVTQPSGETAALEMHLVETEWEGEIVYQVSLHDITEHKLAKAEISEKAAELENRNLALDEFAHTVAHQIQGLLSQIIGYTSYLDMHYKPDLPDEAADVVDRIVKSGHKMNNVISELLLLASMRTGDVQTVPLDMRRIVIEAQKRLRYQIEKCQAQIVLPDTWPAALGYASWIEEAWLNYMSNGLKYGGTPPRLELGATKESNGMIRFWLKDNGPGISSFDQKRLFRPHTRLRQHRVSGDGLGLSIVSRIVKRCGGDVGVQSQEGQGSTFWFTLPEASSKNNYFERAGKD